MPVKSGRAGQFDWPRNPIPAFQQQVVRHRHYLSYSRYRCNGIFRRRLGALVGQVYDVAELTSVGLRIVPARELLRNGIDVGDYT